MERRNFLKGLFGTAIIAAIPKPVFDKIVETPFVVPEQAKVPAENIIVPEVNSYLYLYDNENNLLASSPHFNLEMKIEYISTGMDADNWAQHITGPKRWFVNVDNIQWHKKDTNIEDVMLSPSIITVVLYNKEYRLHGNVNITHYQINSFELNVDSCVLEGSGSLIVETV